MNEIEKQLMGFSAAVTYLALASELPPGGKWSIPETIEQRRGYKRTILAIFDTKTKRIKELEEVSKAILEELGSPADWKDVSIETHERLRNLMKGKL